MSRPKKSAKVVDYLGMLRPYQRDCHDAVVADLDAGRSPIASLPTGVGKGVIIAAVARTRRERTGLRVLVLVHRSELAAQVERWLAVMDPENPSGREQGDLRTEGCLFTPNYVVAMVPSIAKRSRLLTFRPDTFGTVLSDEGHHAPAPSWQRILNHFRASPDCRAAGFSAVWTDAKGRGVGQAAGFDSVAYRMHVGEAIRGGWLVRPRTNPITDIVLDWGELASDESVDEKLAEEGPSHRLYLAVRDKAGDRPTLVFCAGKKQVFKVAAVANRYAPGSARHVVEDSAADAEERKNAVDDFLARRYQFLVNCSVFTEGTDLPAAACAAVARPCRSEPLLAQIVGRVMRPLEGTLPKDTWGDPARRLEAIANSAKPDCVAEGQLVLTDHGEVPIERVTRDMKVWDGVEYVGHCGTIFRGVRPVIEYAGLVATEDHRVWTKDGWATIGECAAANRLVCSTGEGGRPVRETAGRFSGEASPRETACPACGVSFLRAAVTEAHPESSPRHSRVPRLWSAAAGAEMAFHALHGCPAEVRQSQRSQLSSIRRPGHRVSFPFRDCHVSLRLSRTGSLPSPFLGPQRPGRALRAGQLAVRQQIAQRQQPEVLQRDAEDARFPPEIPACAICGCHTREDARARRTEPGRGRAAVGNQVQQTERRVWDILNAGPRNRFTCQGLLVHNCLVLDFTGQGDRKILTSVDILGSDRPVQVRDYARRLQETGEASGDDVIEILDRAEAEWALVAEEIERRRHLKARGVRYRCEEIDLFDARTASAAPPAAPGVNGKKMPPTEKQVQAIVSLGWREEKARSLSRGQASAVLSKLLSKKSA